MEDQVLKYIVTGAGDLSARDSFLKSYVANPNKLINNVFSKKLYQTNQKGLQFEFLNHDLQQILNQKVDNINDNITIHGLIFIYDEDTIDINIDKLDELFYEVGKNKDNILFVISQSLLVNSFEKMQDLLKLLMRENISQIYLKENQIDTNTIKQIDKWIINRYYDDNLTIAYEALYQKGYEKETLIVLKDKNRDSQIRDNNQQCNLI
ncbi:hypothetical protein ABPG72_002188 [Tetrahymena utriculariae]